MLVSLRVSGSPGLRVVRALTFACVVVAPCVTSGSLAAQSPAPTQWYSTHDWTASAQEQVFAEGWVDSKSPGDGRVYSVGTITVSDTRPASSPQFSGTSVDPRFQSDPGFFAGSTPRQVVIVQITKASQTSVGDATNQDVLAQVYFYGSTPGLAAEDLRSTNARGISVWPAEDPDDTRIAICGETYDETIPLSQDPTTGRASASATTPSGFIAVYDGNLALLWTWHFFGSAENGICAVTDVSIRVDDDDDPLEDVVTYCGITTFGNPASNGWLTTVGAYPAPATGLCATNASGSTNSGRFRKSCG